MENIGINLPLLLAFIINFVILFGLLGLLLYKPVLKMLDERQAKIKESIEEAERVRQQTAQGQDEIRAQLESSRKEGQAIIAQAAQMGDRLKDEAREQARQEAESVITKAHISIQQERNETIDQLRREFTDIAILAAEKVINETLDKTKHQKLIDNVLEESSALGKAEQTGKGSG